jgi:serine/threonine protein kinase
MQMKSCPHCGLEYSTDASHCARDGALLIETVDWIPGTIVRGKYRIDCLVGRGGMGSVYKAYHMHLGEICALKVISPELAADNHFVLRFLAEAKIMRKLRHQNAVRVDDYDSEEGRPFIVMEYVDGCNLSQLIRENAPFSILRAIRIARQIAYSLSAAHDLGIIHRDIKPDNIVVTNTPSPDTVKVLDFGIAKIRESNTKTSGLTQVTQLTKGFIVGTPRYMSPEQAAGAPANDLDGRSDLYSLGLVIYEMLTGRLPLQADSELAMLSAHQVVPPIPIRQLRADLPEKLARLIMSCLQKNRKERPSSARALAESLSDAELNLVSNKPVAASAVLKLVSIGVLVATVAIAGVAILKRKPGGGQVTAPLTAALSTPTTPIAEVPPKKPNDTVPTALMDASDLTLRKETILASNPAATKESAKGGQLRAPRIPINSDATSNSHNTNSDDRTNATPSRKSDSSPTDDGALEPPDLNGILAEGGIYETRGDYDRALELYRAHLKDFPKSRRLAEKIAQIAQAKATVPDRTGTK